MYGYLHAQPRDCSVTHYRNMAIWISSNFDIGRSLNSRDSFPKWKFNQKPRKGAAVIAASMHGFANCRKFKSHVMLTLTLDRVKVTPIYTVRVGLPTYPCDCIFTQYRNMWPFECREISTFREVWTVVIPFLEKKFENRAPTGCRPGPILSMSTVSFEQYAEVEEEIDLETCSYGQLSEVQMVRDLDLDRGSGQGHGNIHSTCRTTCTLNRVTVASRTTKIRPFEFRDISTFGEVWTLVIAFVEGNSKIGLR